MHKRGARVVLERFQQVVQPQVADVVVVEVERGQRLVLLESLAQQLGALVRVWGWGSGFGLGSHEGLGLGLGQAGLAGAWRPERVHWRVGVGARAAVGTASPVARRTSHYSH